MSPWTRLSVAVAQLYADILAALTGATERRMREELAYAWKVGYLDGKFIGHVEQAHPDHTFHDMPNPYEEENQ